MSPPFTPDLDFDAATLTLDDDDPVTLWPNGGTAGDGWDLDVVRFGGAPVFNESSSLGPAVRFDGQDSGLFGTGVSTEEEPIPAITIMCVSDRMDDAAVATQLVNFSLYLENNTTEFASGPYSVASWAGRVLLDEPSRSLIASVDSASPEPTFAEDTQLWAGCEFQDLDEMRSTIEGDSIEIWNPYDSVNGMSVARLLLWFRQVTHAEAEALRCWASTVYGLALPCCARLPLRHRQRGDSLSHSQPRQRQVGSAQASLRHRGHL